MGAGQLVKKFKFFPQVIATDAAFCDREEERALLKTRILAHEQGKSAS